MLWIVVVSSAALIGSRGASARYAPIGWAATSQTLHPTYTPWLTATPQPSIASFSPGAGATEVQRHTPLTITFSSDVDRRAIEQGLAIDPPISSTVKWQGRTLVFTPIRIWEPDVAYRVTVLYRDQTLSPSWVFYTQRLIEQVSPSPASLQGGRISPARI